MPIIYTYPVKSTANDNDLILISDSQDSNKTKQIKISDLPGGSGSGVSSVTATLPVVSSGGGTPVISLKDLTGFGTAGQVIKVNSGADGLEWGAAGGSTLPGGSDHSVQYKNGSTFDGGNDLTFHPTNNIFSVKHTVIIKGQGNGNDAGKLKLNCEQDSHAVTLEGPAHSGGANYTLKFPSAAPGNTQILEYENSTNNLRWIATPTSSGATPAASPGGGVQYNDGSNGFAASANITIGGVPNILSVKNIIRARALNSNQGKIELFSNDDAESVSIQGPPNGGSSYEIRMPNAVGTADQVLKLPSAIPGSGASQLVWGDAGTSYTLPLATNSVRGGVKIGATGLAAKNYAIQLDSSERMYVDVPWTDSNTTYSAGTGLALNSTTFSLATGAALTNLGGGTGSTFLKKDGTWDTPTDTNTNIANTNLQLNNNRTLDLSNGDASDYALTFISTLGGVSKNLFKFDQIGATSPRFTVGHTESAYEGTILLEGNGSNRTGQVQLENAAGTYYTSIKAPTTFGANQNINYTLPNLQGVANSVLTNNGSGALSWTTTSEPTEITSTTAVNSTTFANTPFTFASTNAGSGIGAPLATQVASQYGNKHISFYLGTTFSGAINQAGSSSVNYATSSDYRLKENVVEMTGAIDRVKQLKPSRFNFIADGPSRTVDGFLAHEVSSIVPESITGDKDAVDAESNIIPQGIDQSKLVPLLVGAIKELTARIEALEA